MCWLDYSVHLVGEKRPAAPQSPCARRQTTIAMRLSALPLGLCAEVSSHGRPDAALTIYSERHRARCRLVLYSARRPCQNSSLPTVGNSRPGPRFLTLYTPSRVKQTGMRRPCPRADQHLMAIAVNDTAASSNPLLTFLDSKICDAR